MHAPVLKAVWVSARVRNHAICLRCPKCLIALVLDDVDLPYCTSKVEHTCIVAFTAIFSNISTGHAQKRLCTNFRCKLRHRRWIPRPRFPIRVRWFCILYAECPLYFYFRFVWPTDLENIPYASTPTSIILTKFEVDMTIHCRVIAFFVCWYVTWPCEWPWLSNVTNAKALDCVNFLCVTLWPFDVEQLMYMAGHVTKLATKF